MQDRYAGDIGDFGKFGLLKQLSEKFTIGINWYDPGELDFERDENGQFRQEDGKYRDFSKVRVCNKELAEALESIKDDHSIKKLEGLNLIENAVYYGAKAGEQVPRDNVSRAAWHKKALAALKNCGIVFLDPDNGLLCKSVKEGSAKSVKYTYYQEVADYLAKKSKVKAVIIYNHRSRKPKNEYFDEIIDKLCACEKVKVDRKLIQTITFHRCTVRDYFIISRDEETHRSIKAILEGMINGKWGEGRKSFCTMNGHMSSK